MEIINKCSGISKQPTGLIQRINKYEFKAKTFIIADYAPSLKWKSEGWKKPDIPMLSKLCDIECETIWYKRGTYSPVVVYIK